ncbi:MAG: hypothetical protein WBL84_28245 [Xanthobacteraceae bacterium]
MSVLGVLATWIAFPEPQHDPQTLTINKLGTGGMVVHCYPAAGRIFGRNAAPKYLSQCNLWASYQQPVFEMSNIERRRSTPTFQTGRLHFCIFDHPIRCSGAQFENRMFFIGLRNPT